MVSTVLGKATVQVIRLETDGVFVVFRRSFADYVWRLCAAPPSPTALPCASWKRVAITRCLPSWRLPGPV
jgi:hypothetical protein